MDSEGKFWISIWGLASILIISLIFCITFYNCSYNTKVLSALESGIPPKQIRLAFNDYTTDAEKIIYALKETK